jgi:pyridoxine 5-phosphate synthase
MTRCCVSLNGLVAWRDAVGEEIDLAGIAALVDLAGGDHIRLSISENQTGIRESDLQRLAQSVPLFELCMPPLQSMLRLALEIRPGRVLLIEEDRYGTASYGPLDLHKADAEVAPILRGLSDADIPTGAIVAPDLDNVKAAHSVGFRSIELYTRYAADLPEEKRGPELARLTDASMLAAKLRFDISIGGGLDFRNVNPILNAVPMAVQVTIGRSILTRSLFVGIDRAIRDFRSLVS